MIIFLYSILYTFAITTCKWIYTCVFGVELQILLFSVLVTSNMICNGLLRLWCWRCSCIDRKPCLMSFWILRWDANMTNVLIRWLKAFAASDRLWLCRLKFLDYFYAAKAVFFFLIVAYRISCGAFFYFFFFFSWLWIRYIPLISVASTDMTQGALFKWCPTRHMPFSYA